ncbi:glycosyltransferase family 4 protein [bacterium]|nr:glycosyltransferase family 4 protein [bacterium]|tara:strand:+ start:2825 stop:3976 length:1152 start_codon:yes stop_codon:yes gene_type:complete
MNILIYTHEFPPFQGGIATSSKMIADILGSENNLMVCCPSYGKKDSEKFDKFDVHRINFIGGEYFKKIPLLQYLHGLIKIKKIIHTFKPKKILFLGEEAEIIGGLLNEKHIDQIVRVAGSGIESIIKRKNLSSLFSKFFLKRLYKNSKYIIAVSKNTKRLMSEEHEFFSSKKIRLIYNGIDEEFVKRKKNLSLEESYKVDKDTFILLTVSRLLPRKGQDFVIKALGKIRNKNIKYICVGEGSYKEKYKSLVASLDLEDNVFFPGGIKRKDIHKFYDLANAFILCNRTWNSKIEGLPNVAIESMARSVPVIGSKNSGTEELIKDGINGYLVDSEDIDDIAKKISFAYENKDKLSSLGDSAKININENFSLNRMKFDYLDLIKDE